LVIWLARATARAIDQGEIPKSPNHQIPAITKSTDMIALWL
jgi:hypothetical protein